MGDGDITSEVVLAENPHASANIKAKSDGVICGTALAEAIFYRIDERLDVRILRKDGELYNSGDEILSISGPAKAILAGERLSLNFLGKLSGIATLTNQMFQALDNEHIMILDTRKTTPNLRVLEKYAVICGGGKNHRIGLYDAILIKENHIAFAGGIEAALGKCFAEIGKKRTILLVEIEVQNIEELKIALRYPIDCVMLDNFTIEEIHKAIGIIKGRVKIEISGGMQLQRINQYRELAIDYISSGAITHSAPNMDFSMLFV